MVTTEPFTSHSARGMGLARSVSFGRPGMPSFRRVVTLDCLGFFLLWRGGTGIARRDSVLNLLGLGGARILAGTSALHYRTGCASGIKP